MHAVLPAQIEVQPSKGKLSCVLQEHWQAEFEQYKQSPEYRKVNR